MITKGYILLLLCFIASVCCEVTLPGPCPNIPAPANFSWKKMQGSWYVLKETKDENGDLENCPVDTYIFRDNSSVTYLNGFHLEGYTRGEGGPGLIDRSQPNKITIKFTPTGKSFDRYVVDTDYENYAVLIGCKEKGSNHLIHAKLLTKSQTPPAQSKLAAYIALQNLQVPVTSLINNYDQYSYCNGYPDSKARGKSQS